jgi:hypothetical protein
VGDGTNGLTVIKAVLGEDVPQPLLAVTVTFPVVPVLAIILDVVLEPLQSLGNDHSKLVAPAEVVDINKFVDVQTGVA